MKETSFINQNKEKWKRFRELASQKGGDPGEIADLYSDITDDLSYAQTFYNRRTVRVFLNQTAQGIHNLVHKERSESLKKFLTVWRVSLPLEIYRSRRHILFALVAFLLWTLVGVINTHVNPDFPRMVMGDGYVEQTIRNVNNGIPLDVYSDDQQLSMFLRIATHNIEVAFYSFILGIFFTVGTHIFIFSNGVMLGAFQYFFYLKGVFLTSFLGIWIHGAFEISSLVIAAGAGITLGNGWLFPGSYSRLQSLQLAARRGIKIMMSLVPFLLLAGFLESFVTHNYLTLPEWSKWGIIGFSFSVVLFVYVIYPMIVARRYPELLHETPPAGRILQERFDLHQLRSFGQMFSDTFSFYRVHFNGILKLNAILTLPVIVFCMIMQAYNHAEELRFQYYFDWSSQLNFLTGTSMQNGLDWLAMLLWSYVFCVFVLSVTWFFVDQSKRFSMVAAMRFIFRKLPATWLASLLFSVILFLVPYYFMIFLLFLVPLFWLSGISVAYQGEGFLKSVLRGFSFSTRSYGNGLLAILVMLVLIFIISQPIAFVFSYNDYREMANIPDFLDMLADFVRRVASVYTQETQPIVNIVRQVVYVLFILLVIPLFPIIMNFVYHDVREKITGEGLSEALKTFGQRRRNRESSVDFE